MACRGAGKSVAWARRVVSVALAFQSGADRAMLHPDKPHLGVPCRVKNMRALARVPCWNIPDIYIYIYMINSPDASQNSRVAGGGGGYLAGVAPLEQLAELPPGVVDTRQVDENAED